MKRVIFTLAVILAIGLFGSSYETAVALSDGLKAVLGL